MNKTLHTEKFGDKMHGYRVYRVIERSPGFVQVWVDLPAGESVGWPECFYSGNIDGARAWWKANVASKR